MWAKGAQNLKHEFQKCFEKILILGGTYIRIIIQSKMAKQLWNSSENKISRLQNYFFRNGTYYYWNSRNLDSGRTLAIALDWKRWC